MGRHEPDFKYSVWREFLATALLGLITAAVVSGSRPDGLDLWKHLLFGSLLTATMSVVLRVPPGGCLTVIIAFILALTVGGTNPHEGPLPWGRYVITLISLQYWTWGVFELLRHQYRMRRNPAYRERFEQFRGRSS
jgi:hypothetical protein